MVICIDLLKIPNSPNTVGIRLSIVVLVAVVEILSPGVGTVVLRRTPVVVSGETTYYIEAFNINQSRYLDGMHLKSKTFLKKSLAF